MSDIVKQSTIGAKLRKLFSNNKQTVAENIPEEKEFPVPAAPPSVPIRLLTPAKSPTVQDDGSYALATPSGGSNAPLICTDTEGTLDKTMGEILNACNSGTLINIITNGLYLYPVCIEFSYDGRAQEYYGSVRCQELNMLDTRRNYVVHGDTRGVALAAYPTLE